MQLIPNQDRYVLPAALLLSILPFHPQGVEAVETRPATRIEYHTVQIDGLDIFYREAGPKDGPVVLLLHGFPTSSHMFRNLMTQLGDRYHLIAPDYPGFGNSSMPTVDEFEYTFDNLATSWKNSR